MEDGHADHTCTCNVYIWTYVCVCIYIHMYVDRGHVHERRTSLSYTRCHMDIHIYMCACMIIHTHICRYTTLTWRRTCISYRHLSHVCVYGHVCVYHTCTYYQSVLYKYICSCMYIHTHIHKYEGFVTLCCKDLWWRLTFQHCMREFFIHTHVYTGTRKGPFALRVMTMSYYNTGGFAQCCKDGLFYHVYGCSLCIHTCI